MGLFKIYVLHRASLSPVCGIEIINSLDQRGHVASPSLVYPTLQRLKSEGLLRSEEQVVNGKVRKYYETTSKGLEVLKSAKEKVRELVDEVLT